VKRRTNSIFGLVVILGLLMEWVVMANFSKAFSTSKCRPFTKKVLVNAYFYDAVQDVLLPGDIVGARVPRHGPDIPLEPERFHAAIDLLISISGSVKKSIVFSSVDDIATYIEEIPCDVTKIGYNSEGGMTPAGERETPELMAQAVNEFNQIVGGRPCNEISNRRKIVFGPLNNDWVRLDHGEYLDDVLKDIASAGIQGQGAMDEGGVPAFVELCNDLNDLFDENGGKRVGLNIQLWVGRNEVDEIVEGFRAVKNIIDAAVIFSDIDPDNETREIIRRLRCIP